MAVVEMFLLYIIYPEASPIVFFFNDTATTEIYTLSLHDALPIYHRYRADWNEYCCRHLLLMCGTLDFLARKRDRKSTRLNSSHSQISYAVFCLKKKIVKHGVVDHECSGSAIDPVYAGTSRTRIPY